MRKVAQHSSQEMWKCTRYSSIFSRSNFDRLLKHNDYSIFKETISDYDQKLVGSKIITYADYTYHVYKYMLKNYRNEYIFKNSLINMLIKEYGTKNTVIFNEFSVGNSIADLVLFNGKSRAYEIKTELDSDKRLFSQLADYKKIFQQCYIVVYKDCVEKYISAEDTVGVISMSINRGRVKFEVAKPPIDNTNIDPHILIRCLRTSEYQELVKRYYTYLPKMNAFTAFAICEEMMCAIPSEELNRLFIQIMKERKSNMSIIKSFDKYLWQICLSMHLTNKDYETINYKLKEPIQI